MRSREVVDVSSDLYRHRTVGFSVETEAFH